jgi:predicted helicase
LEELIKRHVLIVEIESKTHQDLSQKYYYNLFCKDVVVLIKYIAALYLQGYDPVYIKKIVIGDVKDIYLRETFDMRDDILFNGQTVDKEIKESVTIPVLFEIIDMNLVFESIRKAIESTLIGIYTVSIYFDFFIVNEKTMFLKYEAYQCL